MLGYIKPQRTQRPVSGHRLFSLQKKNRRQAKSGVVGEGIKKFKGPTLETKTTWCVCEREPRARAAVPQHALPSPHALVRTGARSRSRVPRSFETDTLPS